jgi:hypothetical protein
MAVHEERIEIQPSSVVSMISRNEMPSMPRYVARANRGNPVVGSAFDELEAGSKRCAQNMGTSGSETRNPPSAKMFASSGSRLYSLGNKQENERSDERREKMIDSMWFCIRALASSSGFWLLANS